MKVHRAPFDAHHEAIIGTAARRVGFVGDFPDRPDTAWSSQGMLADGRMLSPQGEADRQCRRCLGQYRDPRGLIVPEVRIAKGPRAAFPQARRQRGHLPLTPTG
jgi:hypothetical protein